ncbi:hypothetical protein DFH09DRAFT_1067427 [Mycena vulgaris]|nr:hypothetical protein DFH09DRAFT_1067427 [Mycena vulgaris]
MSSSHGFKDGYAIAHLLTAGYFDFLAPDDSTPEFWDMFSSDSESDSLMEDSGLRSPQDSSAGIETGTGGGAAASQSPTASADAASATPSSVEEFYSNAAETQSAPEQRPLFNFRSEFFLHREMPRTEEVAAN